jgi:Protein of unknown function (DUF2637)
MNLTTFSSRAAATAVAAVAGYSSYRHIVHVALAAGEHHTVAAVLPLAIDGLIVVGTLAMLEDKAAGRIPRMSARFALGFGIVATLAANVASAADTWTARAVAAVPAIAFLIAVEVLSRSGKVRAEAEAGAEVEPVEKVAETPQLPAEGEPELPPVKAPRTPRKATAAKATKATPRRSAEQTRELAEAALASAPKVTRKAVAQQLDITPRRLRQVLNEDTGEQQTVNAELPGQLSIV